MAQVNLEGVTRQFEQTTAIEDITFQIPNRAFWVLIGPSGCGKSTLLRIIAGLESITRGKLYIGDRLVNDVPARQRDVAMVFQNYALYPHMTVAENLAFGLKMRRYSSQSAALKVQEVARSLNIEYLLQRKPRQLSGGQQQRVALGRAIARQPQVFLLDEPLSNLDAQLRDDTRVELKRLHQQFGITTIYVTHDRVEAMTLAEKIVVLAEGRIQQIGSPQEIYDRPNDRMVASFLGNPPMNIIAVTYQGEGLVRVHDRSLSLGQAVPWQQLNLGQKLDLGIRPEHLKICASSAGEQEDCLMLEVNLVEPLGRETMVKAVIPGTKTILNLLVNTANRVEKGDRLTVKFDREKIFLFDANSGQRITNR